jgi:predicted TIM-barrel fold metal-dependent hydrolase
MTATDTDLRYIDSDGHILEHPTAMPDYAPAEYRERIWHITTDADGNETLHFDGDEMPANFLASAGTAGMSDEERVRAFTGEMRYTEVRPAAYNAKARLQDMDEDGIDLAVLYPTMLLGLQSKTDVPFTVAQSQAYNRWASDHTQEGEGRLFAAGAVPAMHHPEDVQGVADEIRAVAEMPGMVSVFMRPNPTVEWKNFNDPVYDPIWQAAQDTGLPIAMHPFFAADLPGAAQGLRLAEHGLLVSQALANPVDVMAAMMWITEGGVCERFPEAKFIFLEANGGWVVPWLERLDHHTKKFQWEAQHLSMLPSEYFRRQCWISFDPDESMLGFTARSELVGADRIIWASDYPHPDAKFPGVTEELAEALEGLSHAEQQAITSESAMALYGIGD